MIDYNHPIVVEMKKLYKNSRSLYEFTWEKTRERGWSHEELKAEFDKASLDLTSSTAAIKGLIKKIGETEDIPNKDKEEYKLFFEGHISNLEVWNSRAIEHRASLLFLIAKKAIS